MRSLLVALSLLFTGCLDPGGSGQTARAPGDPSCSDGVLNGDESDEDCGGSCQPCGVTKRCETADDCESRSCDGECIAATCRDGILNGSETETDCGGPACAECAADLDMGSADMGSDMTTVSAPDTGPDAGIDLGADMAADADMAPIPVCGDGVVDGAEECDDMNDVDTDDCIDCTLAVCGDGFVQAGVEACDDQNDVDTDDCIDCVPATCGDGYVQAGVESCDSMGESPTCDADCTLAVCGDGIINAAAGEQCEGVSGCDANCRWQPVTYEVTSKAGLLGLGSDCSTTGTFPHVCAVGQPYGFFWLDATPYQPSAVRVEFSTGNYCSASRLKDTALNGVGSGQFVLADAPCACESPNPPPNVWDLFNVTGYSRNATNTFTLTTDNGCEGIASSGGFYARITVSP